MTIVPPVANAVKNLNRTNNQKLVANDAETPLTSWIITAHTNGSLRPYLSASVPKTMFPVNIPNMNKSCEIFASWCLEQTKSHSVMIVSLKILLSNSCSSQPGSHFSRVSFLHVNSIGGAKKMIAIWCQATGNLSRKTTLQTRMCHFPSPPIACSIGSSDTCCSFVGAFLGDVDETTENE